MIYILNHVDTIYCAIWYCKSWSFHPGPLCPTSRCDEIGEQLASHFLAHRPHAEFEEYWSTCLCLGLNHKSILMCMVCGMYSLVYHWWKDGIKRWDGYIIGEIMLWYSGIDSWTTNLYWLRLFFPSMRDPKSSKRSVNFHGKLKSGTPILKNMQLWQWGYPIILILPSGKLT